MAKPKKDTSRTIPNGKTQVNFNICSDTLEKAKYLAFWENVTLADIYNKSVIRFLQLYEEKHGEIKPPPTGKGLDTV